MKLAISLLAAIAISVGLGLAAGAITTNVRVTSMKEQLKVYRQGNLDIDKEQLNIEETDGGDGTSSFEMVGGEFHEFGTMETDETKAHTFIIKNVGDAAGVIKLLQTSCKCTKSELLGKGVLLQPGESQDIELTWVPKKDEEEFEQTAKIQTDPNDDIIELRIRGRVIERVCPVPRAMRLAGVPSDKSAEHTLRVFAYRQKDFEIQSADFTKPESADKLSVDWRPMTEDEIKQERGAQSGAIVTVTTKEGLPFGSINQSLTLKTNADEKYESLTVPVSVNVKSDVRIISVDRSHPFIRDVNLLEMGQITVGNPSVTSLSLFVAPGKSVPEKIEMKVVDDEIFPKGGIVAEFGQSTKRGSATLFPLKITIPDDQKPVVLEGEEDGDFGLVVVETNIESAKRIEIFVHYKVVK